MRYYCNTKDRIPAYLKFYVVYEFCCHVCNAGYTGKTDRNLGTQIKQHCGLDKTQQYLIILQSVIFTSTPLP